MLQSDWLGYRTLSAISCNAWRSSKLWCFLIFLKFMKNIQKHSSEDPKSWKTDYCTQLQMEIHYKKKMATDTFTYNALLPETLKERVKHRKIVSYSNSTRAMLLVKEPLPLNHSFLYYSSKLVHALWLVNLAGHTLLHGPLKYKVLLSNCVICHQITV